MCQLSGGNYNCIPLCIEICIWFNSISWIFSIAQKDFSGKWLHKSKYKCQIKDLLNGVFENILAKWITCGMPRHFHLHRSPHWDIFFFVKYDIIQRCGNGSKVDLKFLLSESDPKRNFRKIDCRDKHKCIIPNHKQTRRAGRLPQGHHRSL